jgi:hypothetical protein
MSGTAAVVCGETNPMRVWAMREAEETLWFLAVSTDKVVMKVLED